MILAPETLESQSRALKTCRIIAYCAITLLAMKWACWISQCHPKKCKTYPNNDIINQKPKIQYLKTFSNSKLQDSLSLKSSYV